MTPVLDHCESRNSTGSANDQLKAGSLCGSTGGPFKELYLSLGLRLRFTSSWVLPLGQPQRTTAEVTV